MTSCLFVTLMLLLLCLCFLPFIPFILLYPFIPCHHPSTCLFLLSSYPIPSLLSNPFSASLITTQSLGTHVSTYTIGQKFHYQFAVLFLTFFPFYSVEV